MHREHRNAYLSAMGIDLWQPVKPLTGAEPGHWIASPIMDGLALKPSIHDEERQSSLAGGSVPAQSSASSPAHRDRLIAELQGIDNSQSVRAKDEAIANDQGLLKAATLSNEVVRLSAAKSLSSFTLTASHNNGLLIVDDVSSLQCANSAYQSWIHSVLLALGYQISQVATTAAQQDQFVWPLPESGLSTNFDNAATEIFLAWLKRRIGEHKINQILLMGQVTALVAGYEGDLGILIENKTLSNKQTVNLLMTQSSAMMWSQPNLKRSFWRHLQPFRTTEKG